jgi:hypothetical protein
LKIGNKFLNISFDKWVTTQLVHIKSLEISRRIIILFWEILEETTSLNMEAAGESTLQVSVEMEKLPEGNLTSELIYLVCLKF